MSAPETQAELRAEVERLRAELDSAQEHVAYHLRDYALNTEPTGDLAVDMSTYAGRMKIRAEAAEAKVARVASLRRNYEARARHMPTPLARWADIERDLRAALSDTQTTEKGLDDERG